MKVPPESEEVGKAGRDQTWQGLTGHGTHWGLSPTYVRGERRESCMIPQKTCRGGRFERRQAGPIALGRPTKYLYGFCSRLFKRPMPPSDSHAL